MKYLIYALLLLGFASCSRKMTSSPRNMNSVSATASQPE